MNRKYILALIALVFLVTGCATHLNPLAGNLFSSNTQSPITATSNEIGSKVGTATATSFLGVSSGDSSIRKAAENGGIKKIKTVDVKINSVLGIFVEQQTIVTGE